MQRAKWLRRGLLLPQVGAVNHEEHSGATVNSFGYKDLACCVRPEISFVSEV
jgi:hypothetical protein